MCDLKLLQCSDSCKFINLRKYAAAEYSFPVGHIDKISLLFLSKCLFFLGVMVFLAIFSFFFFLFDSQEELEETKLNTSLSGLQ